MAEDDEVQLVNDTKTRRCPQGCYTAKCTSTTYACAITFMVLGGVLLVIFGFVGLKPYLHISSFHETSCVVNNTYYLGSVECSCDPTGGYKCKSEYPCVHIIVQVTDTGDNHTWMTQVSHGRREMEDKDFHVSLLCSLL